MYASQFPERRHLQPISFSKLFECFLESGSVEYKKEVRNKMDHFHAYHIELHQALSENDLQCRVEFCQWVHFHLQENRMFFMDVLFSDETTFEMSQQAQFSLLCYGKSKNLMKNEIPKMFVS